MESWDHRARYCADGGIVRRFPRDPDELVALARSRVQRDFTVAEREHYSIADGCSPCASPPAD